MVDLRTHFSAAWLLHNECLVTVMDTIQNCWATIYAGYQYIFRAHQCSFFITTRFAQLLSIAEEKLYLYGIESSNSLAANENDDDRLRPIYLKFDIFTSLPISLRLLIAVKAIKHAMNADLLVPSLLLFGFLPLFPSTITIIPTQQDRMNCIQKARR